MEENIAEFPIILTSEHTKQFSVSADLVKYSFEHAMSLLSLLKKKSLFGTKDIFLPLILLVHPKWLKENRMLFEEDLFLLEYK